MRRVPEVIDAWFDSGAMPAAQWHYPFEHEAEFKAHFPADFICEGVDQTRGWFYSLLAIAVGCFDAPAYRNVVVDELVLDAQGQKMSKSRGNVVNPWQVIEQHGADAVRLYLLGQSQVWLPEAVRHRGSGEAGGWIPQHAAPHLPVLPDVRGRLDAGGAGRGSRPSVRSWTAGSWRGSTRRSRRCGRPGTTTT